MNAQPQSKDHLLQTVQAVCADRLSGKTADMVARFAAHIINDMNVEDLAEDAPENVFGAVFSLWKLANRRSGDAHTVRVYNPKLDQDGWETPHTVIETVAPNMPFIVDSTVAALNTFGGEIFQLLHPTAPMRRDKDGVLTGLGGKGAKQESLIQIEYSAHTDPRDMEIMHQAIDAALSDVTVCVNDWPKMLNRAEKIIADLAKNPPPLPKDEVTEARALFKWMMNNHFTFLGYREYSIETDSRGDWMKIVPESGLGLLRGSEHPEFGPTSETEALSPEARDSLQRPELMIVTKASERSTVHRPVHLDHIGVKRFNAKGAVVGERRFIGLFTSAAYNRSTQEIPHLRRKVAVILKRSGFDPSGHAGKALVNVLETYPRDELFQVTEDELYHTSIGIMGLLDRPRIRLFLRREKFGRFFSSLIYVPKERYNSGLRQTFESILTDTLGGHVSAFYTQIGDLSLARLHVIIGGVTHGVEVDVVALETRLVAAARSWRDGLQEALARSHSEERGGQLMRRYGDAFSAAYRERYSPGIASIDIAHIEKTVGLRPGVNLYRRPEDDDDKLRLKLFRRDEALALSDVLPMLEHLGLRVLFEQSVVVGDPMAPICWIHDFFMLSTDGARLNLSEIKAPFEDGFLRIFDNMMENDGLNALIVRSGLPPSEVILLRAYCKFLLQAGVGFSQQYMEETLARNSAVTRLILKLFHSRLDPARAGADDDETATITAAINDLLDDVASLDEDRILRRYLNAVECTLRTNFFRGWTDEDGIPGVSLKFDSQKLDELPLPRPFREIFVYSPRFEGVHLRGGPVARGGLRWSDRREDFRTEVHGLAKAQMVKNSVIVPVGSKGGFVPKRLPPPSEREAFMAEGIACYRAFVASLLDITDNIGPEGVVAPPDTVRLDGDDPYLVVAADKGTADFSDIANAVAIDYGYWLDDAFASGGAAGYDHKGMGITARGAWECVKRHFREMGVNIMTEPFSAVGVGDMSGDVFGNGMLLADTVRLIGAFDHRHIFVDPNPDPAKSFAERQRLFDMGRSSWADYDDSLLSKGGVIIERSAKEAVLTPEAAKALGVSPGKVTPLEVIRAILKAPADLLWLGGIGTFVKADDESNADAGDRANDATRINSSELRVRVVGEGANLGLTQRGRVAFAVAGGRLNTDFVDNSAGVDCSDHEVNLKILLGAIEAAGDITRKQRNKVLADMTDEVSDLVLRDNYLQGQAITMAEMAGFAGLSSLQRLMRSFIAEGLLNRRVEFLPTDEELADRGSGLTRPEISVLMSYAKMSLKSQLMAGSLPDDQGQEAMLLTYFPSAVQKRFAPQIAQHRLRRELIATIVANFIVNRFGPAFARLAEEDLGVDVSDIGRATLAAAEVFDLEPIWTGIAALDNQVDTDVQTRMLFQVRTLAGQAGLWFLRNAIGRIDRFALIERFKPAISALSPTLPNLISKAEGAALRQRASKLTRRGAPKELAHRIALLDLLVSALDAADAASHTGVDIQDSATAYFGIGARLGLDWLRRQAAGLVAENGWERQAIQMLIDDSFVQQRLLVTCAFADGPCSVDEAMARLQAAHPGQYKRAAQIIGDIRNTDAVDLGRLVLANRRIGRLATA